MIYNRLSEEGQIIERLALEKNQLMTRNRDLARELIKAQALINQLTREKHQLGREVEDLRKLLGVKHG